MNWQIRYGEHYSTGVQAAMQIVVSRLERIRPATNSDAKLIGEALQYARLVQGWAKEHQPVYREPEPTGEYIGARPGGKPGPMSDG
jgi:hypothetical protein